MNSKPLERYLSLNEKEIILDSINNLKDKTQIIVDKFYDHFLTEKEILKMFSNTQMELQHKMFLTSLSSIIASSDNPVYLQRELQDIGKRHEAYGVRAEHYVHFEVSFVNALEDVFGEKFDGDLRDAWLKAVNLIVDIINDSTTVDD